MNIFLIGFMGCGKSTLGKKLAKALDYQFIDLDTELKTLESMSIPEIFESKGEPYFRDIESEWLNKNKSTNSVISLGGGAACFNDNMTVINKYGVSVYLKMNSGLLMNRLLNSKQKRPLIDNLKHDEDLLKAKINEMLEKREVHYKQANVIFEASNMSNEKMDELIDEINAFYS